ncbi:MAG TPA: tRNA (adenosine(37)-N6)-threonylcarbamoyltransferase complex ATPase subunit type 1 TsaE [Gemmatimonadales bacterium]
MPDAPPAARRLLTEDALREEGERVGRALPPGSVVLLEGELGAGKTAFIRAVVRGLGGGEAASSPTYTLVHHYEGRRGAVYHVDCYRLRTEDEAADLDWETLATADALLVEWPERAGGWVPPATHCFRLRHVDDPSLRELEAR